MPSNEAAAPAQPKKLLPEGADQSTGEEEVEAQEEEVVLSDVIEDLGLTRHHWHVIGFVAMIWALCGWVATSTVYMLEAASEVGGAWESMTSPADRLTVDDRALLLLASNAICALSNIALGNLSDAFGRIISTEISIIFLCFASLGFSLVRNKILLMLLVFASPFMKDGPSSITGCLLAEWLPVTWRGTFVVLLHSVWSFGRIAVTLLWVAVPPSQYWSAFFLGVFIFPFVASLVLRNYGSKFESPRWLAVSGDMKGCINVLEHAATTPDVNARLPRGWQDPKLLCIEKCAKVAEAGAPGSSSSNRFNELMQPEMRSLLVKLVLISFSLWFASTGMFYWLIDYLKVIGAASVIKPAMFAAPMAKATVAIALVTGRPGYCIVDRCSRITLFKVGFIGMGFTLLLLCLTRSHNTLVAIIVANSAFEEILWCISLVYMTEVFPTSLRISACGIINACGNMGGISSAGGAGLLMELSVHMPWVLSAALMFASAIVCFTLPDRSSEKLSDSVRPSASKAPPPMPEYGTLPGGKKLTVKA